MLMPHLPVVLCRWAHLASICLLFSGCAINGPYHTTIYPEQARKQSVFNVQCGGKPETAELKQAFRLSFVEIDNQGDFFNGDELNDLLTDLQQNRGRILLITYVHGWQNNASVEGLGPDRSDQEVQRALNDFKPNVKAEVGDVQRFKHFLAILANIPSLKNVTVYGVYLGWRGELIENPSADPVTKYAIMTVPRALTFWSREATATKMGDGSAFGVTLQALRTFANENSKRVVTVFMGHSFGAKILEQAITQWALREYGAQLGKSVAPGKEHFRESFGDLVLFMNPASQAIYAHRLISILTQYPNDEYQAEPPLFVGVSSDTDYATKDAFPLGTYFSTIFGAYRHFPDGTGQSTFFRSTSVNNRFLRNGHIQVAPDQLWTATNGLVSAASGAVTAIETEPHTPTVHEAITTLEFNYRHHSRSGVNDEADDHEIYLSNGLVAQFAFADSSRAGEPTNHTQYWLMNVDSHIINGHPDVWSDNAMDLYARLFRLSFRKRQEAE